MDEMDARMKEFFETHQYQVPEGEELDLEGLAEEEDDEDD